MAERDDLDRILDAALAAYANPDSGLEERILARIVYKQKPHVSVLRRSLAWLIAGPAVACALILFHTWSRTLKTPADRVPAPTMVASSQGDRAAAAHSPARKKSVARRALGRRRTHIALAKADRPKLDVFPTPQPLIGEEKHLVSVMAQAPQALREALVAAQEQAYAPLHISEIQIPPLKPLFAGND